MRLNRQLIAVTGVAMILFSSRAPLAQEARAQSGGNPAVKVYLAPGLAKSRCSENPPQSRTLEPYTAIQETTHVQMLADGTKITRKTTTKFALDSSGRTFLKSPIDFRVSEGSDGQQYWFNVSDPVNRLEISWTSDEKVATVYHLGAPVQAPTTAPTARTAGATPPAIKIPRDWPTAPQQGEDLGTKTFHGLEASGARISLTYPAGEIGNDQPITLTSETWISCDLPGLVVLQIGRDPLTGVGTTELTDLERGEPDLTLFQVPEGYTIKDQYLGQPN